MVRNLFERTRVRLSWKSTTLAAGLVVALAACSGNSAQSPKSAALAVSSGSMKGVNIAHAWYTDKTAQSLIDAKSWGANTARIVLATGCRWTKTTASEVSTIISQAKAAGLSSLVLEVHDTTGYGEQSGACTLADAASYWVSIKSALTGQEGFAIVNIGNEPYGNSNTSNWTNDTKAAIQTIRNAGITNTLMVDAPNWGQDWSFTMRDNAASVLAADTRGDVIFDIHMYGVFDTKAEIDAYVKAFKDKGIPLVIGEFGNDHSDGNPDEVAIVAAAKANGIGLIGWSWSGNGSDVAYLDMVSNFNVNSPTSWGTWYKNNVLGGSTGGGGGSTATASISLSSSASSITSGSSVTLTATPTVANTTVSSVEFIVNGSVVSTDTSSPYTYTASPTSTTSYTARVNTSANVSATSSAVSVTVNTQTNNASASVSLSSSATSIASGSSVTLTATPTVSNTTVTNVQFIVNGNVVATDTSSPYTYTASPTSTTSYTARVNTAANVSATSSAVSVSVTTSGGGGSSTGACSATVSVGSSWPTGAVYKVVIKNTGSSSISSWKANWTQPSGHTISGSWNGTFTGTSGAITASNIGWNGNLGAGATTEIGYQVTFANGVAASAPTATCQ